MAKQYSVCTANSIWCTAHALAEFARAKKQNNMHYAETTKKTGQKYVFLDYMLPFGGCEPLWVCACLCGPPLRYATPPHKSRGTCLARAGVAAKQLTPIHCHSTRAPSRVYPRRLVLNLTLARSNMTNLWVKFKPANNGRTDKAQKKVNIKGTIKSCETLLVTRTSIFWPTQYTFSGIANCR